MNWPIHCVSPIKHVLKGCPEWRLSWVEAPVMGSELVGGESKGRPADAEPEPNLNLEPETELSSLLGTPSPGTFRSHLPTAARRSVCCIVSCQPWAMQ